MALTETICDPVECMANAAVMDAPGAAKRAPVVLPNSRRPILPSSLFDGVEKEIDVVEGSW